MQASLVIPARNKIYLTCSRYLRHIPDDYNEKAIHDLHWFADSGIQLWDKNFLDDND